MKNIIITILLALTLWFGWKCSRLAHKYPESFAPKPTEYQQVYKVTAYCPCEKCCGRWSDGYTASGHKIQTDDKFVAAPKQIPFGTLFYIPGYGVAPVRDRGGAIKVDRLDVFFPTHREALIWGVKHLEIEEIS